MPITYGRTGVQVNQDGAYPEVRLGKTGEVLKSDTHARYQEAVYRGNVFGYVWPNITGGIPSSTTTPPWTLYNPRDSNVCLALLEVTCIFTLLKVTSTSTTIMSLIPYSNNILVPNPQNGTNALVGNATMSKGITCSAAPCVAATPPIMRYIGGFYPDLSTASFIGYIKDEVAGAIVIEPGSSIGASSSSTGINANSLVVGMTWEEIPL